MSEMVERVAQALAENRRIRRAAAEHEGCACMGPPEYCQCEQARDLADARAAIAAMRESLPASKDQTWFEALAVVAESAGASDAEWAEMKALAEWADSFDAALDEKP